MPATNLRPPKVRRDRNAPYLAILVQKGVAGFATVHAGMARWGRGRAFCDERSYPEFGIPAEDPNFALHLKDGWRHRYAEAFLELNRGCPRCLEILYEIGREAGWAVPKSLERAA